MHQAVREVAELVLVVVMDLLEVVVEEFLSMPLAGMKVLYSWYTVSFCPQATNYNYSELCLCYSI